MRPTKVNAQKIMHWYRAGILLLVSVCFHAGESSNDIERVETELKQLIAEQRDYYQQDRIQLTKRIANLENRLS